MGTEPVVTLYQEDPALPGYWLYDGLRIQAHLEEHQFVVSYARRVLRRDSHVLDIAAGEGALTKQLQDVGFQVSVTSWNDKMRVQAPSYRVNLDHSFSEADVGGRKYDLVCAIEIIEHVENPAAFLRSCASVVAPGGRMILSTPNVEAAAARLQWLVRGCPSEFEPLEIRTNRHISMMWRQGLEFLISAAGLRIVEKHHLGAFRQGRSLLSVAKRLVYAVMHRLASGETHGSSRLYVLEVSNSARSVGPDEVY